MASNRRQSTFLWLLVVAVFLYLVGTLPSAAFGATLPPQRPAQVAITTPKEQPTLPLQEHEEIVKDPHGFDPEWKYLPDVRSLPWPLIAWDPFVWA